MEATLLVLLSLLSWGLAMDLMKLETWTIQSSAVAGDTGDLFSTAGYDDSEWYPVAVPCTVLAGLLQVFV